MQLRAAGAVVAGAGVVLAGCFYTEPINRQPKVAPPQQLCGAPPEPCPHDNLHHGDHVMVMAVFNDPDSDVNNATVAWKISACDGPDGPKTNCPGNRLYDQTVPALPPYPEFTVPSVLTGTEVPVRDIVFEVRVFDERGASSSVEDSWDVIPDPPAAAP